MRYDRESSRKGRKGRKVAGFWFVKFENEEILTIFKFHAVSEGFYGIFQWTETLKFRNLIIFMIQACFLHSSRWLILRSSKLEPLW